MTVVSSSSSDAVAQTRPSSEPLIEVHDLGVWFKLSKKSKSVMRQILKGDATLAQSRQLWALRGVELKCHEGQTLGIVGHNGAGKSTLCLVLAGILTPDEGQVKIRGKVSTLFSLGAGFNKELSGRDNIELYAAFLGIPRSEVATKTDEIVEFSELGDFVDEPVGHYSSGMRARLAFSVASTMHPEILLLDEILGVGDRAFRAKSQRRIQEMMAASRLIVIVSHAMDFLRSVCTHCLWLDHGQVKGYGPAGEILDAYEAATGGPDSAAPFGDEETG